MNKKETQKFNVGHKGKCWKTPFVIRCIVSLMLTFLHLMSVIGIVQPFYYTSMLAIASVALSLFKENVVKKHQLVLQQKQGYRGNINQPLIAFCLSNTIQHLTRSRTMWADEKKIYLQFIDRLDENSNKFYQFHGYYHRCRKSFDLTGSNSAVN